MFQFSLLGSGLDGPLKTQGGGLQDHTSGLSMPLTGTEGAMAAFSGELQAFLMQLPPSLIQRLDELIAGGMDLPRAARSLLGELAGDPAEGLFADLLQQRLPDPRGGLALDPSARPGAGPVPGRVGTGLAILSTLPRELGGAIEIMSGVGAGVPQAPVQGQNGVQMPIQLASSLLEMGVPQQVGAKGWDAAIADRVMWMVQGDQQFARLRLNPPHLGPLEVRVSVHQDQTSVAFLASQAAVREALEAALPRLREMFDQQSLQLVRADVADPGTRQGDRAGDPSARGSHRPDHWDDTGEDRATAAAPAPVTVANGLIDLFA
jgi:flagellar hook-length control protein FliK